MVRKSVVYLQDIEDRRSWEWMWKMEERERRKRRKKTSQKYIAHLGEVDQGEKGCRTEHTQHSHSDSKNKQSTAIRHQPLRGNRRTRGRLFAKCLDALLNAL